jgi:hypothetical protein
MLSSERRELTRQFLHIGFGGAAIFIAVLVAAFVSSPAAKSYAAIKSPLATIAVD